MSNNEKSGGCRLIHGEAIEEMKKLISEGVMVDAVICDPPYGTTACKWDTVIPFNKHIILTDANPFPKKSKQKIMYEDEFLLHCFKQGMTYENAKKCFDKNAVDGMWEQLKRIIKPNGAIVLFGSQPFTSALVMSNPKMFKYDWVWEKSRPSNFVTAQKQPMRYAENISVFYGKQPTYNPIMWEGRKNHRSRPTTGKNNILGEKWKSKPIINTSNLKYPSNIIKIKSTDSTRNIHPTQKPVALMEYLIKTYTSENEVVLDFCFGSGTTGVACKNLNRNFIGIELSSEYYAIAKKRIDSTPAPMI